jgi:hypothetical protein
MLTQSQAKEAAWNLAEATAKHHRFPLQPEPSRASLESHAHGREVLDGASEFWSFIFRMDVPPGTQVHPDFVHIVVDPETGKAAFIPLK